MYALIRKIALICLTAAVAFYCAGCGMFGDLTADGLFAAPRTAARFDGLYQQVDKIIGSGAEYSSPTSGSNRQSIQFEDIDGDGLQEAVVFLRTGDEIPLMLCIFRQSGPEDEPEYTPVGSVKLEGSSFDSVFYYDLNGCGAKEIVVCCSLGTGLPRALSILEWDGSEVSTSLSVSCAQYTLYDLNSDGMSELVVSRYDPDSMSGVVETYMHSGVEFTLYDSVSLSHGIDSISQMRTGCILYGVPAVFVTSSCDQRSGTIVDIVAFRLGSLTNITLDEETGRSAKLTSTQSVAITDIGNDGALDIPYTDEILWENFAGNAVYWRTEWQSYRLDGVPEQTYETINSSDWYFLLPDSYGDEIVFEQRDVVQGEHAITFSVQVEDENGDKALYSIMAIYVLVGENREDRSEIADRFVIDTAETRTTSGTIYAARIFELPKELDRYAITQEEIIERFHLFAQEWNIN